MIIETHDMIGILGAIFVLVPYTLLQAHKMSPTGFLFSALNLVGAFLILYSLSEAWNLTAVIIETIWAGISLFGLYEWFVAEKAKKTSQS